MALNNLKSSSLEFKDDEWYTPINVFTNILNKFKINKFDYDPATNKEIAERVNILNFDDIETNGLIQDWKKHKNIWINPPFTLKKEFITKAYKQFYMLNSKIENIFILIPIESLTNLNTFDFLAKDKNTNIIIPKGRIKFCKRLESGEFSQKVSPWFSSILIHISNKFDYKIKYLDLNKTENRPKQLTLGI